MAKKLNIASLEPKILMKPVTHDDKWNFNMSGHKLNSLSVLDAVAEILRCRGETEIRIVTRPFLGKRKLFQYGM